MAFRRATLRRMPTTTRRLAHLIGDLISTERKLHNLLAEVQSLELDSKALQNIKAAAVQPGIRMKEVKL